MALVAVMLLVGSAIVAYNSDSLYLAGRHSLTSQLPDTLAPNSTNTILLFTTDASGAPQAHQTYSVDVLVNGTRIVGMTGQTDSRGFAAAAVFVPPFNGTAVLRVSAGGEVLTRDVKALAQSRIFLTTDKPVYQPGQTVHARVLALREELWGEPGADVTFEVKTPEGDRVLRKVAKLNSWGVAALDYPLSDQLPLGMYEFRAIVAGQEVVRNVKVDEYVLPRFEIAFGDLRSWYTFDEDVDAYALVKYFFGQPVAGNATLSVNVFSGSEWVTFETLAAKDLVDGGFEFAYDLQQLRHPNYYMDGDAFGKVAETYSTSSLLVEFNLTVTDTGRHVESDSQVVTVAVHPILITALTDVNIDGERSSYYIVARFPDGAPVANSAVAWTIHETVNGETQERLMPATRTDSRGVAVLRFDYKDAFTGIQVTVTNGTYDGTSGLDLRASSGLKAVSDRTGYRVGDVAQFDVFYAGDRSSDLLFYDVVADGFTIATGHVSMSGDRATLRLPVTSDFGKVTSVRFYKMERNFNVARDVAVIGVQKAGGDLDVDISPDKTSYLPQDPVSIRVRVTRNGEGVAAMLGVSIVDNAVFELGGRTAGFDGVLSSMMPQYADPLYQFLGYVFAGEPTLPSESLAQWSRKDTAPVESTGSAKASMAKGLKADAVGVWWTVLAGLAVVGLVAVLALGPRTRHWKAILVVTMFIVAPVLGVVGLWMNASLMTASDEDLGGFNGRGGDVVFEGDGGPAPPMALGGGNAWEDAFKGDRETQGTGSGGPGGYTIPTDPSITRQYFPETWAWLPVLPTDESGVVDIPLKAPDSITSWDVSVIASSRGALVGVAHRNVTVFQRFFVEPDMPAKAYLGDTFPLKVQVYNYDDGPADVVVRLDTADWFTVVGPRTATVSLNASDVRGVEFTIELTRVGIHELRVSGSSPTFTDNVVRPMRVKPAGERVTDMFQGRLSPGNVTSHNLTILPQLIEGSMNAWAKLQGGVEAAVIEGADGFIHYVSGCGEQSLSTLSIDVLAFRTVREGGLDEAKLMQLEAIVTQGIAHELQYLLKANNGKGRGIVWFPGDQDVHPWLTAWGVITFKDARLAGFDVDPSIISDMQEWLMSQQKSDGSFVFPEWGIYEYNNPKLRSKATATTAYVAHALVYSGIPASDPVIRDAIDYVEGQVEDSANWEDPYVLALGLKLLADGGEGGSPLATRIADRLHGLRTEDNGTTFWGSPTNMISNDAFADWSPRGMWDSNPGFVIETTGYAAQALYGSDRYLADVEGAVKFLVDHRSEFGTWFSTQDTVVAFQTIYAVSERKEGTDITVEMLVDGVSRWAQRIDDSNKDLTFLFDLRPYVTANVTSVELRAQGAGFAMFQVFMEQWLPWGTTQKDEPLELNLTYDRTRVGVGEAITAYASVRNHQDRSVKMALVELTAPVGMRFDRFQFDDLRASGRVDNVEFEDGLVRLYINDLVKGSDVTFSYTLTAEMPAEVTLGGCRVFDMYNALVEMELPPVAMAVMGD